MKRRLYFLLPTVSQTVPVVDSLVDQGISLNHIHALAKPDTDMGGIPKASVRQREDIQTRLEDYAWNINLAIFFLASLAVLAAIIANSVTWTLGFLTIMVACYSLGFRFAQLPNMRISEFDQAINHGKILLLVDVPLKRTSEIEDLVHQHYPQAYISGVRWSGEALGI